MSHIRKARYLFLLVVLMLALSGCELSRSTATETDVRPVGEMAPTLALLGAESNAGAIVPEPTSAPTIVSVKPIVTEVPRIEVKPIESSAITPTTQSVAVVITPVVNSGASGEAVEEPRPTESPVVVNPATPQDSQAQPVASHPPVSETMGNYGNTTSHLVRPGDTLFSISRRYGVSMEAIRLANGIVNDVVQLGQTLVIPTGDGGYTPPANVPVMPPDGYHVVAPGETLFGVAMRYNTTAESIASLNDIVYPYVIYTGQRLILPGPDGYNAPPPMYPRPVQPPQYQQPPVQPRNGYNARTHTVAAGETLFSIANRYGTTAQALSAANGLSNPNQIYVGQVLYLP